MRSAGSSSWLRRATLVADRRHGVSAAFLIMSFYSEVAAWVFALTSSRRPAADPLHRSRRHGAAFNSLITDPLQSLLWQWLVLALMGILLMGVSRGIEAVTKRLMPLLFILLLVIGVRSLALPGASEGLHFLFSPDFSKVTAGVVLTAMGLAFFKLSIGMGCMMTYGSYFRDDQHIPLTTVR